MTDTEERLSLFLEKNYIKHPDETFRSFVLEHIEKMLEDGSFNKVSDIYHRGNIDRKVFYCLKCGNDDYKPSKAIALSYCVALGLSVKESCSLLRLAGYSFEETNLTDQVVLYFLKNQIYSADIVNNNICIFSEKYNIDKIEYIGSYAKEWRFEHN